VIRPANDDVLAAHMTSVNVQVAIVSVFLVGGVTTAQEPSYVFPSDLIAAAIERTNHQVTYDGSYRRLDYPGGDVPDNIGVCTDVIIRSYRAIGIDLQRLVHEDMVESFNAYPNFWGLTRPDSNIDHRRVPNLQRFFARHGNEFPVTTRADDYKPGDLVTWMLPGNLPHIGIVTDRFVDNGSRLLIVHNIGSGPKIEDILFRFPITGHYRYAP
jgi:uncharacterized protein YijF (DUF1287 family)